MHDTLNISMFGEFSISCGESKITDKINRSKKIWSLLEYLITFRNRDISQSELIEFLWDEDEVDDPANTLKTLLHRVRAVLSNLEFPDTKKLIIAHSGTYSWNPKTECVVDTDIFDTAFNCAYLHGAKPEDKLKNLMEVAEIYKGDFLTTNTSDSWVVPVREYYRSRYMKAVNDACEMLSASEMYEEMVELCRKAVVIDPYEERLHYRLVSSLVEIGRQQQALSHYEYVKELFFNKFGINLSEELTTLYKDIVKTSKTIEYDINVIKESLQEAQFADGCFFCEYEFFKNIYRLESRSAARTGQAVHICLFTVSDAYGNTPPQKILNRSMEKLRDVIQKTLRRGDVFTRYSISQYLLMLPMTTYETGHMVMERVSKVFRRENPKSPVVIHFSLQALTPMDLRRYDM